MFKRVWADLIEPVGEVVVVKKGVVDCRTERVRESERETERESVRWLSVWDSRCRGGRPGGDWTIGGGGGGGGGGQWTARCWSAHVSQCAVSLQSRGGGVCGGVEVLVWAQAFRSLTGAAVGRGLGLGLVGREETRALNRPRVDSPIDHHLT